MQLILDYFPELSDKQIYSFSCLDKLYRDWNSKINVISRKDINSLYEKHILHSLAIAKAIKFKPLTKILDVGTGGGFPGIPLSIIFPDVNFLLVDSIGKKINVVNNIIDELELKNISTQVSRVEDITDTFDFIVSRAVTKMPNFKKLVSGRIKTSNNNDLKNGILYLKGGDLETEMSNINHKIFQISSFFKEDFFKTKKIVYVF